MKRTAFILVLLTFLSSINIFAQQRTGDPVLFTMGTYPVRLSEFEAIYKKNAHRDTAVDKQKAIEESLELFINYKLKVKEAEEMGLDTTASLKKELESYKAQLTKPYMTDNEMIEKLCKEAYERMQWDLRANHILVKVPSDASPEDTLKAYNKIVELRNRLLKGESFEKIAQEAAENLPTKKVQYDLGYFTVFDMVYPFETMAYNTKVGEISPPMRTRFGYHVIKVIDRRPAMIEMQVAHIMVKSPKGAKPEDSLKAKAKIDSIYAEIKKGKDFSELVKLSDDKMTANKNGELPWFRAGKMVIDFEKASYALKNNGDISEPIKTDYGWHIIKRLNRKTLEPYDEKKNEIKNKILKDQRGELAKESFLNRLKRVYNFTEDKNALAEFYKVVDTNIYKRAWDTLKAQKLNNKLFSLTDASFTQQDFARFIGKNQRKTTQRNIKSIVDGYYNEFVEKTLISYEESRLKYKYPEFNQLLTEYKEGILLFEMTDQKVWSKAVKDTVGLKEFYEKNKSQYMWDKKADVTIFYCKDEKIAKKARKLVAKTKGYNYDHITIKLNPDTLVPNIKIKQGAYFKGENEIVDKIVWEQGLSGNLKVNDTIVFVSVNKIIPPQPKTLDEAKGLVIADYQQYLEVQWVSALREKYPVKVNNEVLSLIK